eukprot:scaffold424_cov69-Phaeocystis_antarctica.AAC.4
MSPDAMMRSACCAEMLSMRRVGVMMRTPGQSATSRRSVSMLNRQSFRSLPSYPVTATLLPAFRRLSSVDSCDSSASREECTAMTSTERNIGARAALSLFADVHQGSSPHPYGRIWPVPLHGS